MDADQVSCFLSTPTSVSSYSYCHLKHHLDDCSLSPSKKFKGDLNCSEELTVFLSNISFAAQRTEILEALKNCGEIQSLHMALSKNGRFKGFAYAEFKDCFSVEKALLKDRVIVRDRPMYISRYNPRKQRNKKCCLCMSGERLFVQNLPSSAGEDDIKIAFEKYGPIQCIHLITRNGLPNGSCFITFCDRKNAETACQVMDGHILFGRKISALANSKSATDAPSIAGSWKDSLPIFAFQRMSLRHRVSFGPAVTRTSTCVQEEPMEVVPLSNDDFRKLLR